MHYGLLWLVGNSTVSPGPLSVDLHSPNGSRLGKENVKQSSIHALCRPRMVYTLCPVALIIFSSHLKFDWDNILLSCHNQVFVSFKRFELPNVSNTADFSWLNWPFQSYRCCACGSSATQRMNYCFEKNALYHISAYCRGFWSCRLSCTKQNSLETIFGRL